jgi:PAS domain S-box-containing protein
MQRNLILEFAGDGIFGLDLEGHITFANPAAAEMIGYSVEEMVGQPQHELLHHSHADGSPYQEDHCPIYNTLREGAVHQAEDDVFWRRNRTSFHVEYISTPIRDGDAIVGAVVLFKDVSRKKAREAERAELARARDELMSMVAHELSSPVTGLMACADLLSNPDYPDSNRPELLNAIANEGRRLLGTIQDLLDIRRLERHHLASMPRRMDLGFLLKQAATIVRTDLAHPLILDLPVALPLVHADPDRVQQVLGNLLSNARKYTPDGGEIRLAARVTGDMVEVSVKDAGLGIPGESLPYLFGKFYRVAAPDRQSIRGTGLGLAIVKELVEIQGGTVGVESEGMGKGSRFWFTLPIVVGETEARPAESKPARPQTTAREAVVELVPPARVLVVDDEAVLGRMITRVLRSDGHDVTWVDSAEAALEHLRTRSFDVVISDLGLGAGRDGLELAQDVRRQWPRVRIVLASGSVSIDAASARRRGVHELLGKPYGADDLRRVVRRLARRSQSHTLAVRGARRGLKRLGGA